MKAPKKNPLSKGDLKGKGKGGPVTSGKMPGAMSSIPKAPGALNGSKPR